MRKKFVEQQREKKREAEARDVVVAEFRGGIVLKDVQGPIALGHRLAHVFLAVDWGPAAGILPGQDEEGCCALCLALRALLVVGNPLKLIPRSVQV